MIGVVLFTAFLFLQGVWVASPGTAFSVWWSSWDLALGPGLFLLGGGTAVVGITFFGIATARANVLPRWAAVMFALAWPIGIAIGWLYAVFLPGAIEDDPVSSVFRVVQSTGLAIFALGLIRLGYALFAHVRLKKKLSERLPELSRPHLPRSWLPRTGFGNKTVWDWLQLLIVPIVLAVASFWFTLQQDTRQQATEDQRAQDAALQAYLDRIGEFMLKENGPLRESEEGDEVNTLARARTLTVLSRLDGDRKARVVQFLYESRLIAKERPVLDLRGADLNDVSLNNVDLSGANLSGIELRSANLQIANLQIANLQIANLINADLSDADLFGANLSDAA
jgi:hypothetical protein